MPDASNCWGAPSLGEAGGWGAGAGAAGRRGHIAEVIIARATHTSTMLLTYPYVHASKLGTRASKYRLSILLVKHSLCLLMLKHCLEVMLHVLK